MSQSQPNGKAKAAELIGFIYFGLVGFLGFLLFSENGCYTESEQPLLLVAVYASSVLLLVALSVLESWAREATASVQGGAAPRTPPPWAVGSVSSSGSSSSSFEFSKSTL